MSQDFRIRLARPADRATILAVVRHAFANGGRDGQEEIDIVVNTWSLDAAAEGLELVATDGDIAVGYVLGARGELDGREVVGIAPLAVAPAHQGAGVGSALMTELLRRADSAALPLVVLLGNPGYYSRFGFEPSGPLHIGYRQVGLGNPHFQVRRLAAYDSSYRGEYRYCWEAADEE